MSEIIQRDAALVAVGWAERSDAHPTGALPPAPGRDATASKDCPARTAQDRGAGMIISGPAAPSRGLLRWCPGGDGSPFLESDGHSGSNAQSFRPRAMTAGPVTPDDKGPSWERLQPRRGHDNLQGRVAAEAAPTGFRPDFFSSRSHAPRHCRSVERHCSSAWSSRLQPWSTPRLKPWTPGAENVVGECGLT